MNRPNHRKNRSLRKRAGKHAPSRGGYTLIELLVVLSINSVLMAVAVGLLGVLMRSDQAAQRHWIQTSTPARLAAQFRADVAAAASATIVPGKTAAGAKAPATAPPDVLRLLGPDDRTIEYHRDGQYVRRSESRGAAVLRREAYAVPELAEVVFQSRLSLRESSAAFAER
ncbi:MAG TPA: prepilin-type N-terminal cleavage/methylation domain-containing protein, partial [Pirellulales bacterium]|nr:prepilin-type N-terminal cleavage/methylation domain-containing protein [Pirellulales bacterium]